MKNLIKTLFTIIFGGLFCLTACGSKEPKIEPIRPKINSVGFEFNEVQLDIFENPSITLEPLIDYQGDVDKTLIWNTLNNNGVISIDNGLVTALKEGTAIVRATSVFDPSKYANCNVTVIDSTPIPVVETLKSISFYESSITLSTKVDEKYPLRVIFDEENLTEEHKEIIYTSGDNAIASVNEQGEVSAVGVGSTRITATSTFDKTKTASCFVKVNNNIPVVSSISFKNNSFYYYENSEVEFKAVVIGENLTSNASKIILSSSDESVVEINNNTLITKNAGTSVITAKSKYDPSISNAASVTVVPQGENLKTRLDYTYTDVGYNNAYGLGFCPSYGRPKLLVVPVWFNDSYKYISNKDNVREDINELYFGAPEDVGWHSVSSYYEEESKGLCVLEGTTTKWYNTNRDSSYYGGSDRTATLVKEVTNWYFNDNPNEKRTDYDSDGDGFLDGIIIVYGIADYQNDESVSSNFWGYTSWTMSAKNIANPVPQAFFWASYDFMYGDNAYERTEKSYYHSGDTTNMKLDSHCFIHEMGHVFGLNDYYDYGPDGYSLAGGFSMQDYNVGSHDPFSIMALGWADPIIVDEPKEYTIKPFQESHDFLLLSNNFKNINSPFDEYFLVEFYTPTGLNEFDSTYIYRGRYPMGSKTIGIRLWHVDSRLAVAISTYQFSGTTSNPYSSKFGVYSAITNSFNEEERGSVLGSSYEDFAQLQLVRNDLECTCFPTEYFTSDDLFLKGDSFSMSKYSSQFVNGEMLNKRLKLGWQFTVTSISEKEAKITIKKA